jgi:multisubunit Na+/H+ antiporter MnhE subunit
MMNEYLPLALFGLGFIVAALIIYFLMQAVGGAFERLIHPRYGGRE